jgi:hypothetical protein
VTHKEKGDGHCPVHKSGMHCDHWWDGKTCCACGHGHPPDEDIDERAKQEEALRRMEMGLGVD